VVRSVRRISIALSAPALAAGLAGCVTTQEKNSWLLLRNARELATETPVLVRAENSAVRVGPIHVVRAAGSATLAVTLTDVVSRPLTDLPISVGAIERGGRRKYLNGKATIDYDDTHVPAIAAGATVSWILPDLHGIPPGRLFAVVGAARAPASTTTATLPRISASQVGAPTAGRLRVLVANDSGLPQFGLQVYAVALRDGRYVGAGRAAAGTLEGGHKETVELKFTGTPAGASLELYAPPTIFK